MKKNIIIAVLSLLICHSSAFANVVRFAQVTDVHYREDNEYSKEVLKETVKQINDEKNISFVVFTGDNIDSPKPEYLPGFIKTIKKLKVPFYLVIGNHDVFKNGGLSKTEYFDVVKANCILYRYNRPNFVFKNNGFVFITVDGAKEVIPGPNGYYKQDTLNWLEKQLNKYKRNPVIIFQHFPLITDTEVKSHEVFKKEQYLELLDKHDNVISVVAGHLHTNSEKMRNGVYHVTSPSLLVEPHLYKVISITTTKGFSPMIYTEMKEVQIPKK